MTTRVNPPKARPIDKNQIKRVLSLVEAGSAAEVWLITGRVGVRVGVDVAGAGVVVGEMVTGTGVGVMVAGGVTFKTNFSPGWIIEEAFNPFQANKSARLISYS